jgi:outer membrane protein
MSCGRQEPALAGIVPSLKSSKATAIAYINSDTLLKNYAFYKKMKADFEAKQARLETDLVAKEQALRAEAASYQQKAATMTETELRGLQEKFGKKEQEILQYKDKSVRALTEEQQKQNEILYSKITTYLKSNCQHKFKYVLGYSKDGNVLYADDSLNITKQVIEGLNKEYKATAKP